MTPDHIALVQESFQKVATIADQAAEIFYKNLFALDPQLRSLFRADMPAQGRKLMQMLGIAVNGLNTPERIIPAVEELARRHVDYGVRARDYETVGRALMLTLEQGLGADFTPPVQEAWSAIFALLSGVMKRAAYSTQEAA